jgi:hypothetical protein
MKENHSETGLKIEKLKHVSDQKLRSNAIISVFCSLLFVLLIILYFNVNVKLSKFQ